MAGNVSDFLAGPRPSETDSFESDSASLKGVSVSDFLAGPRPGGQPSADVLQASEPLVPFTQPQQVPTVGGAQPQVAPAQAPPVAPVGQPIDTQEPQPFFRAQEFVGESFFDERLDALREEEKAINAASPNPLTMIQTAIADPSSILRAGPEMKRKSEIFEEIKALNKQKQTFLSGKPESVASLPELKAKISQGGEKFTGAMIAGILAPTDEDRVSILERFGWTIEREQGFPVIVNPESGERFQINAPGISERDFLDFAATALQFAPAAKATGVVAGTLKKVGAGATTAGLTEIAKQGIEAALGGEFDLSEVGLSTLFGGAAELAIPALKGIWRKLTPKGREQLLASKTLADIKKLGIASEDELLELQGLVDRVREAQKGIKEVTGVEVPAFRAQATGLPSDVAAQRLLPQLDAASKKALDSLGGQNKKASEATTSILNKIAPENTIEFAGREIRDASKAVIAARRLTQKEASSPIYKQAFRRQRQGKTPLLDMKKFDVKYTNIAKQFDPKDPKIKDEISEALKDVVARVKAARGDLRQLHNVKIHIDRQLEKFGEDSLAKSSKRFMRDVQKDLVEQLTEKSPSYRAAKSEFIRTQGPIDELMDMSIGKASRLGDDELDKAAGIFFNKNITPGALTKARNLIEKNDPEAWAQIVRRELHNRVSGIQVKEGEQGIESVSNMAGQLRSAIFGNPEKRRVLMQGVDAETRKNLNFLDTMLSASATGRSAGSPTAPFQVIIDKLRGASRLIREAVTKPVGSLVSLGEQGIFNRNVRALGDTMFDPRWLKRMSEIRVLDPKSNKAAVEFGKLLDESIRISTQASKTTGPEQPESQ